MRKIILFLIILSFATNAMASVSHDTSQGNTYGPSSPTTTLSVTMSTGGTNRLAVMYFSVDSSTTPSISGGGTWVQKNTSNSGGVYYYVYTCSLSSQQTSTTVTITFASSAYATAVIDAYSTSSGQVPSLDKSSINSISVTNNPSTTITTGQNNALVMGCTYWAGPGASSVTAGSGYHIGNTQSQSADSIVSEYATSSTVSSGTVVTVNFSGPSASGDSDMMGVVSLYDAGSAPTADYNNNVIIY